MSARHRKRLAAAPDGAKDDGSSNDETVPAAPGWAQPRRSGFLAFADSESDSDRDEDGGEPPRDEPPYDAPAAAPPAPTRHAAAARPAKQPAPPPPVDDERLLAAAVAASTAATPECPSARLVRELLTPSERHLNAEAEALRVLGYAQPQQQPGTGGGRRRARHYTLGNPEPHWVAPPTRAAGGFSMVRLSTAAAAGGGSEFALEPSPEYAAVAEQCDAVASVSPELLVELLLRVPHHVGALLALCEHYQRAAGQPDAAAALLRQALFALESAWHPAFRPWDPACAPCRLVASPSDAGLGAAATRLLWLQLGAAGRAGAPRAALEVAKLLLQCAQPLLPGGPDGHSSSGGVADPHRVLLCVDYYAIRARQFEWLLRLTGGVEEAAPGADGPAQQQCRVLPALCLPGTDVPVAAALPNLAYSRALALFHVELLAASSPQPPSMRASVRPASQQPASAPMPHEGGHGGGAHDDLPVPSGHAFYADMGYARLDATRSLVRAMLLYPHALLPLLSSMGLTPTDVGVGVAAAGAAAGAAAAAAAAGAGATHTLATPPSACVWKEVFSARLFSAPWAALKRRRAAGAFVGDDEDDVDDEGQADGGSDEAATHETPPPPPDAARWTDALEKCVDVFVARQPGLWRSREVLGWVFTAARQAIAADKAAQCEPGVLASTDDARLLWGAAELAAAEANTCELVRAEVHHGQHHRRGMRLAVKEALRHYSLATPSDYSDAPLPPVEAAEDGAHGVGGGGRLDVPRHARLPGIWIPRPVRELAVGSDGPHPAWLLLTSALPWSVLPGSAPTMDAPLWGPAIL